MTATMIESVQHENQSKWGWHPCSREKFLELKEAHKLLLRERILTKRNDAYFGKMEKNRKGKPPQENCVHISKRFYLQVLETYQNARHPVATQEEVKPMSLPPGFRDTVDMIKKHYAIA